LIENINVRDFGRLDCAPSVVTLLTSSFKFQAPVTAAIQVQSLSQPKSFFPQSSLSPLRSTIHTEHRNMAFTLAQQMVRSVGVFQGLLALPVLLFTAAFAMQALGYTYDYVYEFTSVFTHFSLKLEQSTLLR